MKAIRLTTILRRYLPAGAGVLFSPTTRRKLVLAIIGSLTLAGLELVGVTGILILMQQLTGTPSGVVANLRELLGTPSQQVMLIYLASATFLIYTIKSGFAIVFRRWMLRFSADQESATSTRLLVGYLHGPYWKVLRRETGEMVRSMYDATMLTYAAIIASLVSLITDGLTMLVLGLFLVYTLPQVTIVVVGAFGLTGLLLQRYLKPRTIAAGEDQNRASARAYALTVQSLSAIKEIKVRQTHDFFTDQYGLARRDAAQARSRAAFLSELPKYVLEFVFIADVLVFVGVVSLATSGGQTLTMIAVFVATGFRMLPSLVRFMANLASYRASVPQIRLVISQLMDEFGTAHAWDLRREANAPEGRLDLRESIEFRKVHYSYPTSDTDVITGLDVQIPAGTSVAFVGSSGAGKSTLLDLLMGLHEPTSGSITVDGVPLEQNFAAWQRSIGLVPQDVYIFDASLRANVAFGVDDATIDDEQVESCLRRAQLWEWIQTLPDGVHTRMGERGARLSGGQRQRVGIARALYTRPTLLILDEATSALDNETERLVTDTIGGMHGSLTIVTVAHRLSTIRGCDQVFYLEKGRLAASGTFESLAATNQEFAHLVDLSQL